MFRKAVGVTRFDTKPSRCQQNPECSLEALTAALSIFESFVGNEDASKMQELASLIGTEKTRAERLVGRLYIDENPEKIKFDDGVRFL